MSDVWIVDAVRTPVGNRNGSLANLQAWELGSTLIQSLVQRTGIRVSDIDHLIGGNALYGGGNPTRLAALHARLPATISALTIDSQCCSGMDSISLGAQMIRSGAADMVIAGGLESWSRAPTRISKPIAGEGQPYDRPAFSPWSDRDPDMPIAAAELAQQHNITRDEQESFAQISHAKAQNADPSARIIPVGKQDHDEYTRALKPALCRRLPPLAGQPPWALTAATIAAQSDAAAFVLLMGANKLKSLKTAVNPVRWLDSQSGGGDPRQPALAPIAVARALLAKHSLKPSKLHSAHVMEAFSVQALVTVKELQLDPQICNPAGGALSRGHPIGASGAIEVVEAFHQLNIAPSGAVSICAIAAAGGLGTAGLLQNP